MRPRRPALFLDRDGVVNIDIHFLQRPEDCRFIEGIFALTARYAARGYAIVIASNQSGIGRGLFAEADFARLMDWMRAEFRRRQSRIDAVYFDPTHPTEGAGAYRRRSGWRKPAPGMLIQAAADLDLDLGASIKVGNMPADLEAGRTAGVGRLVLLDEAAHQSERRDDYLIVPQLADIERLEPPTTR